MNPFEPTKLSPIPKIPIACELPYDLNWDDLKPALPGFNDQAVTTAQAYDSYEKQGLNGGANSCILLLCYPTKENQQRSKTIFLKRSRDSMNKEMEKYRYLSSQGIPTPNLLAAIKKDNSEILLLEFLPTIGINFLLKREVERLLHVLAQVNSIKSPPDIFNPTPKVPEAEFDIIIRGVLSQMAIDRSLPFPIDDARLFEAYQIAQKAYSSFPKALNHNQFFFQQVGWAQREHTRQLVIFDLETMALAPLFFDIATILKPLANYTGLDQVELIKIYLDRLCELSQLEFGIDEVLNEVTLINIFDTFCSLPWLFESRDSKISGSFIPTPVMALNDLYHNLTTLDLL